MKTNFDYEPSGILTVLLILLLILLLSGCSLRHETDNDLHCHEGRAYVLEPRIGDLVWPRREAVADPICKEWHK